MFIRRLRRRRETSSGADEPRQATVGQGILYLHLIVGLQILFLLGLILIVVVMGNVLMTPLWILLLAFLVLVLGIVFIYRKAKEQVQELRQTLKRLNLSNRNHEISIMRGVLTLRVEDDSPRLIGGTVKPTSEGETTKESGTN